MTVTIRPFSPAGTAAAPPSKSMAHRLLLCAGLSEGKTAVRGAAPSEDVLATLDCLRALGAACDVDGDAVTVSGGPLRVPEAGAELPCRESGSTLRFVLPLCLTCPPVTLSGSGRLLQRPLEVYREICARQGISFAQNARAVTVAGRLRPGEFTLPGFVSSQFVSGLLLALPMLDGDSEIRLLPPVESRSYIGMTLSALRRFGVRAAWTDGETIAVPGRQRFLSPGTAAAEGDWSNAAFLLALGEKVTVTGLDPESLQGDRVCVEYFRALDGGAAELDLSDCPDLGPVLFAYAAARHGGVFTGTARLRLKESDRGAAMAAELRKFGVEMAVEENRITVGGGLNAPAEALEGHNDHRIVMALAVLCANTGGTIRGAEAVRKSFPDFFGVLRRIGGKVEIRDGMDQ